MTSRRGSRCRRTASIGTESLAIRLGSRRSPQRFDEIRVTGAHDAIRLQQLVRDQIRHCPHDPLIMSVNGYQPWLGEVLACCIVDSSWPEIEDLARKVRFTTAMQFPARVYQRNGSCNSNCCLTWSFIVEHVNVPQVYDWSVGIKISGDDEEAHAPDMSRFRLRTGAWICKNNACLYGSDIPVMIIFTCPTAVSERVVSVLLFEYLYKDDVLDRQREDVEEACWIFLQLYWLLTDWQNVIGEANARLVEAEVNSHGQHLPVKARTRVMHNEVDNLFELKEYLHFHMRAFKKLQQLGGTVSKEGQKHGLWDEIDDAVEDLAQFDTTLDGLKERFNNLIELEFNIQNAIEADNAQFLSAVASIFLPISYLASLFGMTAALWPPVWYLYVAVPVFIVSITFTAFFPWAKHRMQDRMYPVRAQRVRLDRREFTMLGSELPDHANAMAPTIRRRSTYKPQRYEREPLAHRHADNKRAHKEKSELR